MKKFYVLLVVCLSFAASVTAQTYFWIGPSSGAGGNWNDVNNWSFTSGGGPAGSFPNNAAHNVVFSQNALVHFNEENIDLLTLTVNTGITAKLFVTAAVFTPTINLFSTSLATPGLRINSGARLEDSCDANIPFTVTFGNNAKGLVDGTWYFAGRSVVTGGNGPTFIVPPTGGFTNRIDVNGTIQFRNFSFSPNIPNAAQGYLIFNSGSTYWLDRNGGSSPRATWNANSTILITGVTSALPSINIGTDVGIGNLVYNSPGTVTPANSRLSLPNNLIVKGNLQILNTNARVITLASNGGLGLDIFNYTINGNFDISGNSRIALADAGDINKVVTMQVLGNANIGGTSFDIQIRNNILNNATTLKIAGNLNHTAGTFGSSGPITSTTTDLYIVEMNGSSAQTITSTGTIDNAGNEITLLINNAAGVTLTSPLAVGKISFNSANKGRVTTTSTNVLTINNTGVHSLVVNAPASNGFVSGPVRRRTASTNDYTMPTGKGSVYDPPQIRPSSVAASVYQAEYFGSAFSDLSVVTPLIGVSNQEYWQINTISGADAAILLSLTGAVPGALASHGVVVSHYNGSDWTDYSMGGTIIQPGNSTTGTARSTVVNQNGVYTFGYGIAGALPINLLTFDAKKISSGSAQVNWLVSSGSNPEQFEILKSSDGRNFNSIGTVRAADRQYNYSFADNNLSTGTSYYRLKLIDKEGKISYSQIVAVLNGAKGVLLTSLIPTVVSSTATLTVSSSEKGNMQLMVTDMHGRIVKQQIAAIGTGNQQVILNLLSLPAGAYQVTAFMNNSQVGTIRFIRQ